MARSPRERTPWNWRGLRPRPRVPCFLSGTGADHRGRSCHENHLISHGTIAPVKNSLELARLALEAQVPVLFVGKPYEATSEYWEQFRRLVDNKVVKQIGRA